MAEITIADILSIALENLPSLEVQQAMLDEIEQLKQQGLSEGLAVKTVFGNNNPINKAH